MKEKSSAEKNAFVLDEMKWTQIDFAEVMGVGQKTISFWFREIKLPSLKNRERIDMAYLFVRDKVYKRFADPKRELLRRISLREKSNQEENQLMNSMKISSIQYYKNLL